MVDRIIDLCRENGTNLRQLELALGFSNGIIQSWRKKEPSANRVCAVAEFFGVSVEWLMTGEEKTAPAVKAPELSEYESTFLETIRKLSPDERAFLLRQTQALASHREGLDSP